MQVLDIGFEMQIPALTLMKNSGLELAKQLRPILVITNVLLMEPVSLCQHILR